MLTKLKLISPNVKQTFLFYRLFSDYNADTFIQIPVYKFKKDETLKDRKNRLIYQSRKRGILENDLLLRLNLFEYLQLKIP